MFLLDTNVVAELTKQHPQPRILRWFNSSDPSTLWISSITIAEMLLGIALMPDGERKDDLANRVDRTVHMFAQSCVSFDPVAAIQFADIAAKRRRAGKPIEYHDAQIAAIARATGFALATRNTKDFEGIDGLTVFDPFG